MINNMDWFEQNLKNNIPFAFARFNDGEMMGIANVGSIVARGDQYVDTSLSEALKDAIQHRQKNYYVGIPCSQCYPQYNKLAKELVGDYEHVTSAVVTTNRNWKKFIDVFPKLVADKRVLWIGGDDQKTENLKEIGVEIHKKGLVPSKNSWRFYDHILNNFPKNFQDGDIVCVSLGPTARVLIKEWYKQMPNTTFIDVGSNFDPFTRNVYHNCHKGWDTTGFNMGARCQECN
tara:strand:+ start:2158 stop:2853 length:696 start_codon:yes stop_codon:yes gene_type:complete